MRTFRDLKSSRAEVRLILCADGDEQMCALFRERLVDYRLMTAGRGTIALNFAKKLPFDVYIVSAQLRDPDAPAFCRALRQFDPKTPIISYAAEARDGEREAMLKSGAQVYIVQPFDMRQLELMIDAAIKSQWLDSVLAKIAEHAAMLEEVKDRSAAVATRTKASWEESERLREHLVRLKAYKAFIDAGGVRANFRRLWPGMADIVERKFGLKPKMPQ